MTDDPLIFPRSSRARDYFVQSRREPAFISRQEKRAGCHSRRQNHAPSYTHLLFDICALKKGARQKANVDTTVTDNAVVVITYSVERKKARVFLVNAASHDWFLYRRKRMLRARARRHDDVRWVRKKNKKDTCSIIRLNYSVGGNLIDLSKKTRFSR